MKPKFQTPPPRRRTPPLLTVLSLLLFLAAHSGRTAEPPRGDHGSGTIAITGELKQWHKVTLTLDGPFAHERDLHPNPFTDYRLNVDFRHESGLPSYRVPGYFAGDGSAAESSAQSGTAWRAHLSPDKPGRWHYTARFARGPSAALEDGAGEAWPEYDGREGEFVVEPTDKSGADFRAKGRLHYVGKHHLQHAGTGDYFLKAGPDAPETLLAYEDFDGTAGSRSERQRQGEARPRRALHRYEPHMRDWRDGDPEWRQGRGRALIGALNYLSGKGLNSVSFLPYNAGGDGDNVWPFVSRDAKLHYDVSKLDQWGIVFDHATSRGLHLHFKLQENEIDDHRVGHGRESKEVREALDGGQLGPERKLYLRELTARFGHALAMNWNLGEENTQSTEELAAMAGYLAAIDPYRHPIVVHTFPDEQNKVYEPLLGDRSALTGVSLQNEWNAVHARTLQWVKASAAAGRPWVVANDEQGNASFGVPPDPGFQGFDGMVKAGQGKEYDLHDIRKLTLWGNLMAGGAGVEYYFGYNLPENDLTCEDWRSRDRSWDYCRLALDFFRGHRIPFWEMSNANELIGNARNNNDAYCFAKPGDLYLVYLPNGGTATLNLAEAEGEFTVAWFNPRAGGPLQTGTVTRAQGRAAAPLGAPPADVAEDWLAVVRR